MTYEDSFNQNLAGSVAMQYNQPPKNHDDLGISDVLQTLMLTDTDIQRILKGNISEPLDKLNAILTKLDQNPKAITVQGEEIITIGSSEAKEITQTLKDINKQMADYKSMIPFLFALSPLIKVSNLSQKTAEYYIQKINLMVTRYRITSTKSSDSILDKNFFDAYLLVAQSNILSAVNGWYTRMATEEKRHIISTVETPRQQRNKRKIGVF